MSDTQDNAEYAEDQAQVAYHTHEVEESAQNSMDFLGGLALPEVCNIPFPPVFLNVWSMLTSAVMQTGRDFSKYAIGLPRGHGKTIVLKLLILYIILFTRKKFILVVCASVGNAENILADVADMLDSDNIKSVFGNWNEHKEKDTNDLKKFHFRGRDIILAGIGSSSTLRGLNLKFARPDVMICDDMQSKEQAASEIQSMALIRWFVGTLLKSKSPTGCTFMYVGNMYPDLKLGGSGSRLYTCILRNLQNNPNWKSWLVGAILSDGTALWEELFPIDQLLDELEDDILMGCAEVFYSEVLNDPTCGSGKHFDISKLPEYTEDDDLVVGKFIMIDPSLGKKKSDAQQVGLFYVFAGSPVPVCMGMKNMQVSAPKLVELVLAWALEEGVPLILGEVVAYQETLLQWFEYQCKEKHIEGINFRGMPAHGNKNSRIIRMFKQLMEGTLKINSKILSLVLTQISAFDPLKQTNTDDILDVLATGAEVPITYPEELLLPYAYDMDGRGEQGVVEDNCAF